MGKHGGVAGRQHLSMRAITLGVLLLAGVATTSWWWSLRTPSDPIDQNPVAAQAFVVSSPSCTDRGAGTVIDLFPASGGQTRALINGCGYTDGQQLAVEYLAGDPSLARAAGVDAAAGTDAVRQWWPIALGVLAVLAAGLAVVLVVDGRRFRRHPPGPAAFGDGSTGAGHPLQARHAQDETADGTGPDVAGAPGIDPMLQLTAMVSSTADRGAPSPVALAGVAVHPGGRHARPDLDDEQPVQDVQAGVDSGVAWGVDAAVDSAVDRGVDSTVEAVPSRLDLVFPSTAELAASLQDELFTHRHAQVSGG